MLILTAIAAAEHIFIAAHRGGYANDKADAVLLAPVQEVSGAEREEILGAPAVSPSLPRLADSAQTALP